MTKFLIVGDAHGKIPKIKSTQFDAIICTGDVCSSELRTYMYKIVAQLSKGKKVEHPWYELVGKRKARKMIYKSVRNGRRVLRKLNSYKVPVFLIPGNWDWTHQEGGEWAFLEKDLYHDKLIKGFKNIVDLHEKIVNKFDLTFIGYGECSGPELIEHRGYKSTTKKQIAANRKKYKKLLAEHEKKFKKAKHPVVFLSHNVPFNTKLDLIEDKKSPQNGKHFGSNLTRDLIEKYQPVLCVGGHIHDQFRKQKIGKTLAINAGFERFNSVVEVAEGKVKKVILE